MADNQINIARSLVDSGLIYGYVDFRQQSLENGISAVMERFEGRQSPGRGQKVTGHPVGFGLGKELLSREIRNILDNL